MTTLATPPAAVCVTAAADRHAKNNLLIWGLIPLATKVATADTGGLFYAFQHTNMPPGGPPQHIHHNQDEWFVAIDGEFIAEVAHQRFRLKPGDSLFAPRGIPHAWACATKTGTLLTTVSPAGTFEQFIMETTEHPTLPSPDQIAAHFARHDMTVTGPPLSL